MLTLKVKPASVVSEITVVKLILGSWKYVTRTVASAFLQVRKKLGLLKKAVQVKTESSPGQVTS